MISKSSTPTISNQTRDYFFRLIHQNNLIYNTSWEDPRIDRQLLQIDANSSILMITGAGCNVLDYLLDQPKQIFAVDVNSRQNALLALRLKAIEHLSYSDFFRLFGKGRHIRIKEIYHDVLRPELPDYAQHFWDTHYFYFEPNNRRRTFYFRGTAGTLAWTVHRYLKRDSHLWQLILQLLNSQDIGEQRLWYDQIEPRLWNKFSRQIVRLTITMSLLGVPRPQIDLIKYRYDGGLYGFIRDSLRFVFTQIPIHDNYFWRVYLIGQYTSACCPNYLKKENYPLLRKMVDRVHISNDTFESFLEQSDQTITHYNLLDHQDWMAEQRPDLLLKEWNLILKNSRPGTQIIQRTAANELDFIPKSINSHLRFHPELTQNLHSTDRVGTYGSLHLAEVTDYANF